MGTLAGMGTPAGMAPSAARLNPLNTQAQDPLNAQDLDPLDVQAQDPLDTQANSSVPHLGLNQRPSGQESRALTTTPHTIQLCQEGPK
ncbi:UNVERIFIED_CONTAM: hypothetical protein FKN15_055127 [Acipenser sinensis]